MIDRRKFLKGIVAGPILIALFNYELVYADGTKVLRVRFKRDLQIIDPAYMIGGQESAVQYALFPRLAVLNLSDRSIAWEPSEYVEKLEQTDDLHIEFKLKKGFQWTNGYGELTAEDVKYSFERMKESDYKTQWDSLKKVDVTGRYSGTLILNFPYGPLIIETLSMGVGCIVCKRAVEKTRDKKFALTVPASCGPYVIQEHTPKQKIILSRNPNWTGTLPDFDEIRCIIVGSSNASEMALEAGELDLTRIDSRSISRYMNNLQPNTKLKIAGYLNHSWIGMNTQHPKLKDLKVRKAIQRAIDIEKIQKIVYKGMTKSAHGIVPPGLIGHRAASGYKYDPEMSRTLLRRAGVENLSLELVALNKDRQMLLTAQIIQNNLKKIGIKIKIRPLDSGPYWNLGREKKGDTWKNSQLWIMAFGGTVDPSGYFQWFLKDQVGNWNWERWTSEEFDRLYNQGMTETDPRKRSRIYVRMQEIMENAGAYVWLNHDPEAFIHKKDIEPDIDPEGIFLFTSTRKL